MSENSSGTHATSHGSVRAVWPERAEIRAQFRNYCGLDSSAMLMVFRYMTDFVPRFRPCAAAFPST